AGNRIAVAQAQTGEAEGLRLHHQLFRVRSAAQEGEIGGGGEFEVTHGTWDLAQAPPNPLPLWSEGRKPSRILPVHEPGGRGGAVDEVAIKAGAEQPEAQARLVFDQEIVSRRLF